MSGDPKVAMMKRFNYMMRLELGSSVRGMPLTEARRCFEVELEGAMSDLRTGAREAFERWYSEEAP